MKRVPNSMSISWCSERPCTRRTARRRLVRRRVHRPNLEAGDSSGVIALAVAQIGVHPVLLLHLTTAPDNTNNALALAFGVLIVTLIITGSLWIVAHLNHNMLPMHQMMQMQR